MRRVLRRLTLFSIIFYGIYHWFDPYASVVDFLNSHKRAGTEQVFTRSSITYLLPEKKWIEFAIPPHSEQLKIITTPNLHFADRQTLMTLGDIRYTIEYELLDAEGKILLSKPFHHRTTISLLQDKETFVFEKFFKSKPLLPTNSVTNFILLRRYPDAAKIRIRTLSKDPSIADVAVRSYQLERRSLHLAEIIWQRLYPKTKTFMARGNVYELPYMQQSEKTQLATVRWRPIGPLGVTGVTFNERRMFILEGVDHLRPYRFEKPTIYADANLSATRFLLSGDYRIDVKPVTPGMINGAFAITRHTRGAKSRTTHHVLAHNAASIPLHIEQDTLIEFVSALPISIALTDTATGNPLQLPPRSFTLYRASADAPVSYRFYTDDPRHIRIECRTTDLSPVELNITSKNRKNHLIDSISHTVAVTPSRYDYIDPFTPISEPRYTYVQIPRGVSTLEIRTDKLSYLRVSSRIAGTDFSLYPFFSYRSDDLHRRTAWFEVRPDAFHSPEMLMRKTIAYSQIDPPILNPAIAQGAYRYDQLFPNSSWRGHEMLMLRGFGNRFIREQAWKSLYRPITSGRRVTLRFKDDAGLKYATPQLVYRRRGAQTNDDVAVFLDDVAVSYGPLFAKAGTITLPPATLNEPHTLQIKNGAAFDFFINHATGSDTYFSKRLFIRFDKPLVFTVDKQVPVGSIGFQLALPAAHATQTFESRVRIQPVSHVTKSTYDTMSFERYRLHFDAKHAAACLTQAGTTYKISDAVFLPLGDNIGNGRHSVSVFPPQSFKEGYLFVNYLESDVKAHPRLSKEPL